jgi:hypothetical protein
MRSAGNFNPEWGYLAPAPSFMRTARLVLVATAVGATAGAVVVLSLVERPAADAGKTSIAAHALVTSVQAATAPAAPMSAPSAIQAQIPVQVAPQASMPAPAVAAVMAQPAIARQSTPSAPASGQAASSGVSEASVAAAPGTPASIAALAEAPPATEASPAQATDETVAAPDAVPGQKKATNKHGATGPYGQQTNGANTKPTTHGLGPVLRHLFSARAGTSYYPGRGL